MEISTCAACKQERPTICDCLHVPAWLFKGVTFIGVSVIVGMTTLAVGWNLNILPFI